MSDGRTAPPPCGPTHGERLRRTSSTRQARRIAPVTTVSPDTKGDREGGAPRRGNDLRQPKGAERRSGPKTAGERRGDLASPSGHHAPSKRDELRTAGPTANN